MSEESSLPIINISSQDTNLMHQDPCTNSDEVQNFITAIPETEQVEPYEITFIEKEFVDVEPIVTFASAAQETSVSNPWPLRK